MTAVDEGRAARKQAEEALRASEETNRALLSAIPDMMFRLTKDGVYLAFKADRDGDLALPGGDVVGKTLAEVLPPKVARQAMRHVQRALHTGTMQVFEYALALNGVTRHFEARNVVSGADEVLTIVRDITERVRARELLEQRVVERTRELSTLLEISHNVASTLELQPLLGLILDQLKAVTEYSHASILTLHADELQIVSYRGPLPPEEALQVRYALRPEGIDEIVLRRGEPVIIDDVRGETPLALDYRAALGDLYEGLFPYVRACMIVPLTLKDRVIGMMSLSSREPGYYTRRHAALALAVANQAAVAIENAWLYERAQQVATQEERQRLARELHDSVSQALYGIGLGARTARTLLDQDPGQVAKPLEYVLALAEAGLAEMRALIFELLPTALETEGLVAALEKQVAAVQARYGIVVNAALDEEPDVSLAVKEALYRIGQEALHNAVKHAQARAVEMRLAAGAEILVLEVRDNGSGFDPRGSFPGHLGLHTMRERATRLAGTLEVESAPGAGTRIRAEIPRRPASPHPS